MRVWLTALALAVSVAAASALPPSNQIIIFGKQGSASGGDGGGCTMSGTFDLTNTCNNIYFIGGLK